MKVAIIVAVSANGVIGRDNDLPWRLSADLVRFKRLTMGHHLIMGRRTFDSIGRPLPGRTTVVLTRSRPDLPEGVLRAASLDQALALCGEDDQVFVAGGAAVFAECLPRADLIHLTRLHADFDGDVFFPPFDEAAWDLVSREDHQAAEGEPCDYSFLTYQRPPKD